MGSSLRPRPRPRSPFAPSSRPDISPLGKRRLFLICEGPPSLHGRPEAEGAEAWGSPCSESQTGVAVFWSEDLALFRERSALVGLLYTLPARTPGCTRARPALGLPDTRVREGTHAHEVTKPCRPGALPTPRGGRRRLPFHGLDPLADEGFWGPLNANSLSGKEREGFGHSRGLTAKGAASEPGSLHAQLSMPNGGSLETPPERTRKRTLVN